MSYETEEKISAALPDFCRLVLNEPEKAVAVYDALRASPVFAGIKIEPEYKPTDLFKATEKKVDSLVGSLDLLKKLFPTPSANDTALIARGVHLMYHLLDTYDKDSDVQLVLVTMVVKLLKLDDKEFIEKERTWLTENVLMRLIADFPKEICLMELVCIAFSLLYSQEVNPDVDVITKLAAELAEKIAAAEDVAQICNKLTPLFAKKIMQEIDVQSITNLLQVHSGDNNFAGVANKAVACLLSHNKYVMARKGFKSAPALSDALLKHSGNNTTFAAVASTLYTLMDNNPELSNQLWDTLAQPLMDLLAKQGSDNDFILPCTSVIRRLYEFCDEQVAENREKYRAVIDNAFNTHINKEEALVHLIIIKIRNRKPEDPIPPPPMPDIPDE